MYHIGETRRSLKTRIKEHINNENNESVVSLKWYTLNVKKIVLIKKKIFIHEIIIILLSIIEESKNLKLWISPWLENLTHKNSFLYSIQV